MTHEQQRICNHNVGPGETIKIVAFAGMIQCDVMVYIKTLVDPLLGLFSYIQ